MNRSTFAAFVGYHAYQQSPIALHHFIGLWFDPQALHSRVAFDVITRATTRGLRTMEGK